MAEYPEPTVGALIFHNDKLFLMKSYKWHGKWVIPGGHIELGETMQEALKREVKEETALDIHDIEFIMFQEFIFDKAYHKKSHFIFFDFSCRTDTAGVVLNDEGQEYMWLTPEEALQLDTEPYTTVLIEEWLKRSSGTQSSPSH